MKQTKMTSRKTPLQSRSRERVELIIASAEKLLKEIDLSKITTSRIAEEACIPVGSIYQYFKDRDEILLALGEKVLNEEDQKIATVFEEMAADTHWRTLVAGVLATFVELVSMDQIHYRLDIALSDNQEWQTANLASEERMVVLFADYYLFAEKGYRKDQALAISRVIVVVVSAIVNRSKLHCWQGDLGALLREAERMVTAYLSTVFGD